MLASKRILLIIGGGIAAFKALDLIRRLRERGAEVTPVLTRAGEAFVTPLSVSALAGHKVYGDLFDLTDEAEMGHIELSRSADLIVVAPATADLMAKMAGGHADDLASTLLLATDTPVLLAPAMNVRMWEHPATERNIATLKGDGIGLIGPGEGDMACGEFGPGRMLEPEALLQRAVKILRDPPAATLPDLSGKRVLITAGPTREAIDPVRYISNHSSGKQGYAIAAAAARAGAAVTLVSGPVSLPAPPGVACVSVHSAVEMHGAVMARLGGCDAFIGVAAVADFRPVRSAEQKLKKPTDRTAAMPGASDGSTRYQRA